MEALLLFFNAFLKNFGFYLEPKLGYAACDAFNLNLVATESSLFCERVSMKAYLPLFMLALLSACQATPVSTPQTTAPGTSNQVITLPQASAFVASLTGAEETPAVTTQARGYAVIQLNQARDTMSLKAYVAGLSGPITGSHLHLGALGKSGEVIKDLQVEGTTITGSWKRTDAAQAFTQARLDSLLKGEIYLNVHTEQNPNGEIRGQLLANHAQVYPIALSGSAEVPPVTTNASGVAWAQLNPEGTELKLSGWVYGLSGAATGAHLHKGAKGKSGEVLKDVTVTGSELSMTWARTDASNPFTPGVLDLLAKGELYLNVHTAANPNGEIRGQVEEN